MYFCTFVCLTSSSGDYTVLSTVCGEAFKKVFVVLYLQLYTTINDDSENITCYVNASEKILNENVVI